ncbi:carboxylesterase family protein [Vibrio chagasii]|nr:carboxylesterase family protein [Vibrio chagasii]
MVATAVEQHSGNYGIQDQKAALQWIHANIDSFGGGADSIALFGESAGAMSIGIQLMDEQQNSPPVPTCHHGK